MTEQTVQEKLAAARADLAERDGVLVAFSGGVDSSVVAGVAHDALGSDAVACTAKSETLPAAELEDATRVAEEIGIRYETVTFSELDSDSFIRNDEKRCYHCRTMRLSANRLSIDVVCDGTNASDPGEGHRPGLRAVDEFDAYSPSWSTISPRTKSGKSPGSTTLRSLTSLPWPVSPHVSQRGLR